MGRQISKLSALAVLREKKPGLYSDGGGLYLQVSDAGAKSWIFRFMLDGRARQMGLGSLRAVSLSQARDKARDALNLCSDGVDPIDHRKATRASARFEAAKAITFKKAATDYIAAHKTGWSNEKHAAQWTATLESYVYPIFGDTSVHEVDVALVMKVLEPIWAKKPETATRVRGRIESVLDWATARGYRRGENPARWRGHLSNLLPKRSRVQTVKHHPALPYADIGGFMADLRAQGGIAASALQFLILTAARTGEVIGARCAEIGDTVWTVPADRTKTKTEHRVPLSARALEILAEMKMLGAGRYNFAFPGARKGKHLSNMAMLKLLRRMGRDDLTVHGFRSTFRDWAAEMTGYPREVAEMALGHAVGDKVEAAYRRGDLFKKRRRLMDDWARYCGAVKASGKVVPMRAKAG
ncbi:MAG: integrase arm-type DNA-binding domain-containing protein [Rhodospirillales bacterium]|nr:integrase arm-type DNA-binding domain-containing protein [Rhodospirillales bacterium]